MFRIEYTNYTGAYTFKAIDNVKCMHQYNNGDGRIVIEIATDSGLVPDWAKYYPSDDVIIDIVPVQG